MLEDKGSERAVLAGLCKFGVEGYYEIADIVDAACFTDVKNSLIYKCLESLFIQDIKKIDIPLIFSAAHTLNVESTLCKTTQDQEFIRSLFNFPSTLENLRTYAIKIVTLNVARKAQIKHKEAFDKLSELKGNESLNAILSITEAPYSELLKDLNKTEESEEIGMDIDEYLENKLNNPVENIGVPTPFPIFNRVIGDGMRTGVHLVAARFKNGKSTFGKEIALHMARVLKIPILYIDTEMQKDEQVDRILASLSNIDIRKVEKGKVSKSEEKALREAAKIIKTLPFTHKRVSGMNFKEILALARRWINHKVGYDDDGKVKPHAVIYDYFKLMDTGELKDMQEYQVMGFQIAAMHDFCAEYNTPVLAFVQTNRDGISGDSTNVIAQSDRLGWNCVSLSLWKRKTSEEIGVDGPKNGNAKLIPLEGRFMDRLDDGDWINFYFDTSKSIIKELNTQSQARQAQDAGFKHNGPESTDSE